MKCFFLISLFSIRILPQFEDVFFRASLTQIEKRFERSLVHITGRLGKTLKVLRKRRGIIFRIDEEEESVGYPETMIGYYLAILFAVIL